MKKAPQQLKRNPGKVMTDRKCRCGCGRALRVNNTSGWSGYCNPAKVAAGERAPRASEARKTLEDVAASRTVTAEQLDVTKLADDALIALTGACRREVEARQARIRSEAEERAAALAAALEAA